MKPNNRNLYIMAWGARSAFDITGKTIFNEMHKSPLIGPRFKLPSQAIGSDMDRAMRTFSQSHDCVRVVLDSGRPLDATKQLKPGCIGRLGRDDMSPKLFDIEELQHQDR